MKLDELRCGDKFSKSELGELYVKTNESIQEQCKCVNLETGICRYLYKNITVIRQQLKRV